MVCVAYIFKYIIQRKTCMSRASQGRRWNLPFGSLMSQARGIIINTHYLKSPSWQNVQPGSVNMLSCKSLTLETDHVFFFCTRPPQKQPKRLSVSVAVLPRLSRESQAVLVVIKV